MMSPLVHNHKIAHGTPLHRLQDPDIDGRVLVGDVLDCCRAADPKQDVVSRLADLCEGKMKGEQVIVPAEDIAVLTELLVNTTAAGVAS